MVGHHLCSDHEPTEPGKVLDGEEKVRKNGVQDENEIADGQDSGGTAE